MDARQRAGVVAADTDGREVARPHPRRRRRLLPVDRTGPHVVDERAADRKPRGDVACQRIGIDHADAPRERGDAAEARGEVRRQTALALRLAGGRHTDGEGRHEGKCRRPPAPAARRDHRCDACHGPAREHREVRVVALHADITREHVDAVVNAANSRLARGGGVCGAIFAAAGPELEAACTALGGCATGDAVVTTGFRLPARWIVHTVGPVWQGGASGEPEALRSCYRRSLEVARTAGARTIAFPAISTGIFGYPPDAAAAIAVAAVHEQPELLDEVRLVAFDAATLARYDALLSSRSSRSDAEFMQ